MTDPRELQASDVLSIDCEPLSGVECRVSDTEVEDIGITETFAVTLVCGSEQWSIVGTSSPSSEGDSIAASEDAATTADSTATISEVDGDREVTVNWNDIRIE